MPGKHAAVPKLPALPVGASPDELLDPAWRANELRKRVLARREESRGHEAMQLVKRQHLADKRRVEEAVPDAISLGPFAVSCSKVCKLLAEKFQERFDSKDFFLAAPVSLLASAVSLARVLLINVMLSSRAFISPISNLRNVKASLLSSIDNLFNFRFTS